MGLTQGVTQGDKGGGALSDVHRDRQAEATAGSSMRSAQAAQYKQTAAAQEAPCWIVPAAGAWGPACRGVVGSLQLPNLKALWPFLQATPSGPNPSHALTMPHELALLEATGLPATDGHTPWAAWALQGLLPANLTPPALRARDPGPGAWAWFQPCHWSAGSHDIHMAPPQHLDLSDDESQTLMAAVAPYAAQDGIRLEWVDARHWLACGEVLAGVASASADRVNGESLQTWLPLACPSGLLRRLQNEMQMLLYTHPINDARSERGLPTINAFWPWGLGSATAAPSRPAQSVLWLDSLCAAARQDDANAWAQAWQKLDATAIAQALSRVRAGQPLRLVLCGASARLTTQSTGARGLVQRWTGLFKRTLPVNQQLEAL
jgi:hypothetical protein